MEYYIKQPPISTTTLAALVTCESGWNASITHKNPNGSIDWGIMQDNDGHYPQALKMDLDFENNEVDNIEYGFYLITQHPNLSDYTASKSCRLRHGADE